MKPYRHAEIGEEIRAIGGAYAVLREERLDWRGREVLVVIGAAQFDTSCCGVGGCGYALVPGYIVEARPAENVTFVDPVEAAVQESLAAAIRQRTHVQQVRFWEK